MANEDEIRAFLEAMRERHRDQVDNVELPDGTTEFIESLINQGDTETLLFVLKLSYLMGLQTGFAISEDLDDDDDDSDGPGPAGPIEA